MFSHRSSIKSRPDFSQRQKHSGGKAAYALNQTTNNIIMLTMLLASHSVAITTSSCLEPFRYVQFNKSCGFKSESDENNVWVIFHPIVRRKEQEL